MKKYVLLLLLIATPIFASPLNELTRLLGSYTTYTADFDQVTLDDQKHYSQGNKGRIYIQRPDSFRWETNAPDNELVIARGAILWHYDQALAQATKQRISVAQMAQNPAMILMRRVSDISKRYIVRMVQLHGHQWFQLKPKHVGEGVRQIYLYFDQAQMQKLIVVNNLGERSLFMFSHIQLNHALNEDLFEFKPPKGVDVDVQSS